MTRNDIHRPSLLDPADYEFVAAFYQGTSDAMAHSYREEHAIYTEAVEGNDSGTPGVVFGGNYSAKLTCDHCGSAFAHGVLFKHLPTGELIHVGHICATQTVGLPSRAAVARKNAERDAAEEKARLARREANAEWRAANADIITFLEGVEQAEIAYREAEKPTKLRAPHAFLNDMVHTINKYGALTDAQANATRKFAAKAEEFARRDAEKPAEVTPETPLVEGRRVITGTILSTKWQESDYGSTLKMLILEADGNKVWGSVPEHAWAAFGAENNDDFKGRSITLTATVTRSNDDEHFGFYKRPTGAQEVSA